ncbi:MAG: NAD-binding protein [Mycobacterium sp.]
MPGHFIVCGDDALAQRIIDELKGADASVVLLDSAAGLKSAGVTTAHAVIAAAAEDSVNLQVALLARRLSPSVRVVARLSNPVLRAAMSHGGGDVVLDVADLAAPSVVEALLGRNAHAISVSGTDFIVAGSAAPRDGTLRDIYGRLAPVAIVRGEGASDAGAVIACPPLDTPVMKGDWTAMIGQADELAAQGMEVGRTGEIVRRRRRPIGRIVDAVRTFSEDIHPTFYRALAVLFGLLMVSTLALRFCYRAPGMGWMDALYFSTETLATVGYGDFNFMHQPIWLRLWGVIMMLGGVATTAIVVAFVADGLLSRRLSESSSRHFIRHIRGHFVVVGLGSFGIRVVSMLKEAGYSVVVIERNEHNRYLSQAAELHVPVIIGDATIPSTLEAARVEYARAIAVLTENDMINIETAIVLREVLESGETQHGKARPIVVRIYDPELGESVGNRLGFNHVRSTVDLSAPWFIGAAMGLEVVGTFSVGQHSFMVGGVTVQPGSDLNGCALSEFPGATRVVTIRRQSGPPELNPRRDARLHAGDTAYLVGPYHELLETLRMGQRERQGRKTGPNNVGHGPGRRAAVRHDGAQGLVRVAPSPHQLRRLRRAAR